MPHSLSVLYDEFDESEKLVIMQIVKECQLDTVEEFVVAVDGAPGIKELGRRLHDLYRAKEILEIAKKITGHVDQKADDLPPHGSGARKP